MEAAPSSLLGRGGSSLGLIALFWLGAFFSGYPAPFIDDMWYAGPALSLVQHGTYSNYLCDVLAPLDSQKLFLVYVPLHSYVLAAWLKIYGISSASLRGFHTLAAFGASCALWHLLRPATFSRTIAVVICVLIYVFLGGAGLRPDALGLFLLFLGLRVFRSRGPADFFLDCLFLGLAIITSVNTAGVAFLAAISSLALHRWVRRDSWRKTGFAAAAGGLAFALAFLLFLWLIDFRLPDFLRCTRAVHGEALQGVYNRFMERLYSPYWFAKWVICESALLLALIFYARACFAPRRTETGLVVATALAGFGLLAWVGTSSAAGGHWWAFGCMAGALFLITRPGLSPSLLAGWILLLPVFTFGHGHLVVEDWLAARPPAGQAARTLQEVAQISPPPARIYADEYAWREIYDYRLPANGYDFESARDLGGYSDYQKMPPSSVAVASPKRLNGPYHLLAERWRRAPDLYRNMDEVIVIQPR